MGGGGGGGVSLCMLAKPLPKGTLIIGISRGQGGRGKRILLPHPPLNATVP